MSVCQIKSAICDFWGMHILPSHQGLFIFPITRLDSSWPKGELSPALEKMVLLLKKVKGNVDPLFWSNAAPIVLVQYVINYNS